MIELQSLQRLSKDLKNASKTLSVDEARFLVDAYYAIQEDRIRSKAQTSQLEKASEPHEVLAWLSGQNEMLENQIRRALDSYSDGIEMGRWARSVVGIGPVIASGLLAHIDITKAPTVGHIWRFAGLDPTVSWGKGEKRPWNASLKTLCWKIGESFVKVSGRDDAEYGKWYVQRKEREIAKNEAGDFAEQAASALAAKRYRADTKAKACYESGKLPPGHIHARAKRWAVKLFLSHYHEAAYRDHYGTEPPLPYPIAIQGHAHKI